MHMEGPSTPPEQIQRLPPTPPTPFYTSSRNNLICPLEKQKYTKRLSSWLETPCPVAKDVLLSPKKTPQNIFEKKEEKCINQIKSTFLSRNISKKREKKCNKDDSVEKMFFYDEKNPFFLKSKEIFNTEKEPIKKLNKTHNPEGFSFLFRGKKILQPFTDDAYDLKPKQLFAEMLSSLNTTIDEMNDEFTPSKRKRRKNNLDRLNRT
ncbi:hypothetical protein PNEG_00990 [Pneumocystis murina B123]|uniref:Uncharacterized protein n=1 Tax=Pneumocystis murina (strain B123) TaxID=1069680 RepID=M7PK71_PNEMU|nr:hypothetical protein PNEG_00990 [Pneumocystis murina B123]EMR10844.1 hypothetical protein PNEG_00990 [Pneumocystis murina B123]